MLWKQRVLKMINVFENALLANQWSFCKRWIKKGMWVMIWRTRTLRTWRSFDLDLTFEFLKVWVKVTKNLRLGHQIGKRLPVRELKRENDNIVCFFSSASRQVTQATLETRHFAVHCLSSCTGPIYEFGKSYHWILTWSFKTLILKQLGIWTVHAYVF